MHLSSGHGQLHGPEPTTPSFPLINNNSRSISSESIRFSRIGFELVGLINSFRTISKVDELRKFSCVTRNDQILRD